MIMVDASGTPLAVHTDSASPAEVKLVQDTLDASFGLDFPERLIGDKRAGVLKRVRSAQESL